VIWTQAAVRDLEEIVSFVASDSPRASERLLEKVRAKAGSLETNPRRGRIVPELQRMGIRTWRELVVRPYRLLYRVKGNAVVVLAVFDGRRDLEDVLLERLVREP
jgi:addiction module RelE/StbE family toxin